MEQVFYMVYNPRGRAPTYRHDTFESAKTESERLARGNPGEQFFILKSMGYSRKADVEFVACSEFVNRGGNEPEIPF